MVNNISTQPEHMAGFWDWLTGGYFKKTPEERAAIVLGKGQPEALAVFLVDEWGGDLGEWTRVSAEVLPAYREGVLVEGLKPFEIDRKGENIELINFIEAQTGEESTDIVNTLITLERRAKAGQIDRELWAPLVGGATERFFQQLTAPGANAVKTVAIVGAVGLGLYVYTLARVPKIRPLSRGALV